MNLLTIAQIVVAVLVTGLVLLQERSGGSSGIFGGGGGDDTFYQTRRGMEQFVFVSTIVLIVIFAGLALVSLLA
jgi:protein translocase SecG subunit